MPGLGFLPGLVCPHHDKVQSNGVLRAADFDVMLLRHAAEMGIGIDHWAALVVAGGRYRVMSLEGKEGSVLPDASFSPDRQGVPGIWLKQVWVCVGVWVCGCVGVHSCNICLHACISNRFGMAKWIRSCVPQRARLRTFYRQQRTFNQMLASRRAVRPTLMTALRERVARGCGGSKGQRVCREFIFKVYFQGTGVQAVTSGEDTALGMCSFKRFES